MISLYLKLKYKLINYLLWHDCKLCGIPNFKLICDDCKNSLELTYGFNDNYKKINQSHNAKHLVTTSHCIKHTIKNNYYDALYCQFSYTKPLSSVLHQLKYNKKTEYAYALGYLFYPSILQAINMINRQDNNYLIIPMPLHKKRKKERGFNQVEYLLHYLQTKNTKICIDTKTLIRTQNTEKQIKLTGSQRQQNITNAFKIVKSVKQKNIILVDDVITTGASINEVAKLLKEHGAKTIYACCLMHTKNNSLEIT